MLCLFSSVVMPNSLQALRGCYSRNLCQNFGQSCTFGSALVELNEWEPGATNWREAACLALEEEQVGDSEVGGYWNSFWSAVPVYNLSDIPPLTLDAWWVVECHWDCKQAQLTKMNFSNHPLLSLPLVPLLVQDRQLLFSCWPLALTHWSSGT